MPKSPGNEHSLGDQLGLPSEELQQSTSAVDQIIEAGTVKTEGESTALSQTTNDLQGRQELEDSSFSNNTQQCGSKFVHENHATDCNKSQTFSREGELQSEITLPEERNLKIERDDELGSHLSAEKKTDFSKTDASQIIADVVESIEQESTPPVAPPRRRKKKKKADGEVQVRTNYGILNFVY